MKIKPIIIIILIILLYQLFPSCQNHNTFVELSSILFKVFIFLKINPVLSHFKIFSTLQLKPIAFFASPNINSRHHRGEDPPSWRSWRGQGGLWGAPDLRLWSGGECPYVLPLKSRINEHFNVVFVSKVTLGNSIFGQIVYFALNSFVNLHLIRFEILGLCCINYPLAIFCAGSNSAHGKVVQGFPRVLQIRSKELPGAEKVFCPTKTLSECKLDIKSFPFTGIYNSRNSCATLRAWCWRTSTRTCRATTPARSPPRSSTRLCRWSITSLSCVSDKIFRLKL